jgi:hypothetical protein
MYPLVWYDLTREQYSRSRGRGGDSIILTKERRRGREIPDSYGAAISLVYATVPRLHVTPYNLSSQQLLLIIKK